MSSTRPLHIRSPSCVHGSMEAAPRHVELGNEAGEAGEASFEAFFSAEWPRVVKALLLLTGSKEQAEDVAQGAFLRILERWDRLDHEADLEGYLFRTALNGYRSIYRRTRLAARRVLTPGRVA